MTLEPEPTRLSDCLMRIAHAQPFEDWDANIAQILERGLQKLPSNNGTQEWMENVVGICLGAIAEAAQPEPVVVTDEGLLKLLPQALLAGILLNRNEPLAPHHTGALLELLEYPNDDELRKIINPPATGESV